MDFHFSIWYILQGNSNSLATIDVAAGYVGMESYKPLIVGLFLSINTYSAPVLAYLTLIYRSTLSKSSKWWITDEFTNDSWFFSHKNIESFFSLLQLCETNFVDKSKVCFVAVPSFCRLHNYRHFSKISSVRLDSFFTKIALRGDVLRCHVHVHYDHANCMLLRETKIKNILKKPKNMSNYNFFSFYLENFDFWKTVGERNLWKNRTVDISFEFSVEIPR